MDKPKSHYYGRLELFDGLILQANIESSQASTMELSCIRIFPNVGKYGPEIAPDLDIFHAANKQTGYPQ